MSSCGPGYVTPPCGPGYVTPPCGPGCLSPRAVLGVFLLVRSWVLYTTVRSWVLYTTVRSWAPSPRAVLGSFSSCGPGLFFTPELVVVYPGVLPRGWSWCTLVYILPGYHGRMHSAHIPLSGTLFAQGSQPCSRPVSASVPANHAGQCVISHF